jgi:predicted Zn finger-like uncharacterized protein
MSNPINVSCPECQKQLKVSEELRGKKVRCKGCGHVFAIPAAEAKAKAKPAPAKGADDDGPGSYGVVAEESSIPRCPHCAQQMESADAVVCIHCGYSTATRQRIETKKVIETTGGDRLSWVLPGLLAIGGIFLLAGFDLWYCLKLPALVEKTDNEWLSYKGFRVWVVVFSLFLMAFAGRFAFHRLVLNPTPPEEVKR